MYNEFYNLKLSPFQISCDPAFMWFGEKHKEALATLKYGILDNKGFLLLTGDVGTGKTSLINALVQSLGQDIICTSVPDPSLDKVDFFNYIAASFGMNQEFITKGAFLAHFKNFLLSAGEKNKKVLLIIDEAQLLTQEMLEEIRLLSNIEKQDAKLINIFFIGQNEFNEILNRPQNRAVLQRMTLNYNLDSLTPDEVDKYIRHRLKVAGTLERLFDQGAVQEIFLYSGGFPRRINILCDHSLLSGFVREQRVIDASIVKECAKELKIPAHIPNRDINALLNPGSRHEHENNTPPPLNPPPGDMSARDFDPQPPVKHSPPLTPQPPQKKFSWGKVFILICFFILAWCYMFPEHYYSMLSRVQQQGDIKQETDKTIQPEDQSVVRSAEHPDNPPPQSSKNVVIKRVRGDSENPEKLMFDIEIPQTAPTSESNTPLPLLSGDKITVWFKHNGNEIIEKDLKKLNTLSKALIVQQNSKILISGYTDVMENGKYNVKLSEFRAKIVKGFLLGLGVKNYQMKIQGKGGQNPIESNDTTWGTMMNPRVEIEVIE